MSYDPNVHHPVDWPFEMPPLEQATQDIYVPGTPTPVYIASPLQQASPVIVVEDDDDDDQEEVPGTPGMEIDLEDLLADVDDHSRVPPLTALRVVTEALAESEVRRKPRRSAREPLEQALARHAARQRKT